VREDKDRKMFVRLESKIDQLMNRSFQAHCKWFLLYINDLTDLFLFAGGLA